MKKRLIIAALTIVLSFLFTGCSSNELVVYNALNKQFDASSLETETQISVNCKIDKVNERDRKDVETYVSFLNDTLMSITEKIEKPKNSTEVKTYTNANLDLSGVTYHLYAWSKEDPDSLTANNTYIYKIPSIFPMSFYRNDFSWKRNLVYNQNDLAKIINDNSNQNLDKKIFSESFHAVKNAITQAIQRHPKLFDGSFSFIQNNNSKVKDTSEYTLKINDKQFKSLLRLMVNELGKDKEFTESLKKAVKSFYANVSLMDRDEFDQDPLKDIDNYFDSGMLVNNINSLLDAFDNVQILGEEGMKISYFINKDGYIVDKKGEINIVLDTNRFEKAVEEAFRPEKDQIDAGTEENDTVVLRICINFGTHINGINTPLNIEFPSVDKSNSIDMAENLKQSIEEIRKEREEEKAYNDERYKINNEIRKKGFLEDYSSILINGKRIPYSVDVRVIKKGDVQLIPIRSLGDLAGIEVTWDESTNSCTAAKGDITVVFKPDSDIAVVNGVENSMGVITPVFAGKLYVPAKFTTEVFGGKIDYKTQIIQTDISIE